MSERHDTEHLESRRLSLLLDDPGGDGEALAHLETCERCRSEFETLSRMRMALSGLGELDPPRDEWARIERALEARGVLPPERESVAGSGGSADDEGLASARGRAFAALARWPVQVAAAFLLFAGGIMAGLQLTSGGTGAEDGGARVPGTLAGGGLESTAAAREARAETGQTAYLRQVLGELERLGQPAEAAAGELDPVSAAERLARLDALIGATREAVAEDPADPVSNALLFQLVEQREELASRLNQSLHLATLEYR